MTNYFYRDSEVQNTVARWEVEVYNSQTAQCVTKLGMHRNVNSGLTPKIRIFIIKLNDSKLFTYQHANSHCTYRSYLKNNNNDFIC